MLNFVFILFFLHRTICIVTDSCHGKNERIIYTNLKSTDPKNYDYVHCAKYFFMMMEYLMITNGTFDGVIIAMNSKDLKLGHITKTPMSIMNKLLGFVQVRKNEMPYFSNRVLFFGCISTIVSTLVNNGTPGAWSYCRALEVQIDNM